MESRHLEYFSTSWDNSIREFEGLIARPLAAFAEEKNDSHFKTFEFLSSEPGSCSFKFLLHYFTVRLEASKEDFSPIFACRRKRDLSDATDLGEIICSPTVEELYDLNDPGRIGMHRITFLILMLTGLDKVEYSP